MNYTPVILQFRGKSTIKQAYSIHLIDLKDTIKALELPDMQKALYEIEELRASINNTLFKAKTVKKALV